MEGGGEACAILQGTDVGGCPGCGSAQVVSRRGRFFLSLSVHIYKMQVLDQAGSVASHSVTKCLSW